MPLKTEEKEIDGHIYETEQLLPTGSMLMGLRLIKLISPLAGGMKFFKSEMSLEDALSDSAALNFLSSACAGIDEKKVMSLIEDLCKLATRDGKQIKSLNTAFYNDEEGVQILSAVKVAAFVAKVNFGGGLLSKLGNSKAEA